MEKSYGKVYSATYSGVDVYELIDTTGSIMRRKHDGWVNATHILKAANFPKAKRTRILEKDVQTGVHEKVQGGYGKYQGTWVPLETAIELAKEFKVEDRLSPLFELVRTNGADSPPPAPKHHHASKNSSINEKSTKAKKLASMPNLSSGAPELGSFTDHALLKKRGRPKRQESTIRKRILKGSKSMIDPPVDNTILESDSDDDFEANGVTENEGDDNNNLNTERNTKGDDGEENDTSEINIHDGISSDIDHGYGQFDSQNLIHTSSPSEFLSDNDLVNAMKSPNSQAKHRSHAENNKLLIHRLKDNFDYDQSDINGDDGGMQNQEHKWYDSNAEYIQRLLDYFMRDDDEVESILADFITNPPKSLDIDQILDEQGNTIFHWTCAMGSALAADAFIKLGANYRIVNKAGETSLMRAVQFTNSYNKRTFPRLIELLTENIFEFDSNHRTVLHHIALAADSKSRIQSAYYYMDILLAKISESQLHERTLNYLNLQDADGNTALHICAKNANRKCIKLLLDYKAQTNLKNNNGLVASEILLESENATPRVHQRYEQHLRNKRLQERRISYNQKMQQSLVEHQNTQTPKTHVSEAAIEASQKVSKFFLESLGELSSAYDNELQKKDDELAEVENMLSSVTEELRLTQLKIAKTLSESLSSEQIEAKLTTLEDQIAKNETLTKQKEEKLHNILERSQAKSLADLVQTYETDSRESSLAVLDTPTLRSQEASKLVELQIQRQNTIEELVKLYSGVNETSAKMQQYVKLISFSAEMDPNEVVENIDELLKQLEEAVKQEPE